MSATVKSVTSDKKWVVKFWCEWKEWIFIPRYKWHNFTFVGFDIEWDRMMGNKWEVNFALLGFHLFVGYFGKQSPLLMGMVARMDQFRAGLRDGKSGDELGLIPHDDIEDMFEDDDEPEQQRESFYQKKPPSFNLDWMNDGSPCGQCDHCGAWLVSVRPGKAQCDNCGDDYESTSDQWEEQPRPFTCPRCGGHYFGSTLNDNFEVVGYVCHSDKRGGHDNGKPARELCGWRGTVEEYERCEGDG